jgi:2-C-methyl-D-erythritol 2,4-cyclodiphosphate synthase
MQLRVGHGYDLHRLQPGGTLMLGGVAASREMSAVAHSDGDVVLHALVDALLGAIAEGDIGEHFPSGDPCWAGADSTVFVHHAMQLVSARGYRVVNADVMVLAERPRLKSLKGPMRERLASLLQVQLDQVNVKAGTNEGCDAIGRGEAIAADAVVLLERSPA